jgi:hypothetical protein
VLSDQLTALGFAVRKPTNAFGPDARLDKSKIYVLPGSEPVADSLSHLLGGLPVLPMPTPAWIDGGTAALGDVTVLVMLGTDLAGKKIHA